MHRLRSIHHAADGRITEEDYELISPWWQARGGDAPARELLPTCGAISEYDGKPIACAFAYLDATGSGVAMLAWMAACPGTSAHKTGRAMLHLLRFMEDHCERLNYGVLMASYGKPSIISTLKRLGFQTGDTGMTQLFKEL
jgi:hypothetical protein